MKIVNLVSLTGFNSVKKIEKQTKDYKFNFKNNTKKHVNFVLVPNVPSKSLSQYFPFVF